MIGATKPTLQEPVKDPARLEGHEACLPKHRRRQAQVREDSPPYGGQND